MANRQRKAQIAVTTAEHGGIMAVLRALLETEWNT
jgi:hypothetical protein